MKPVRILGVSGSLRKASYNSATLRAAAGLVPDGASLEVFDLSPIPVYNDDVRAAGYPPVVQDFRSKIEAADAILFVTPEYNYSMSGVLKNAIDWASRPPGPPLTRKAVGIMGATMGLWGTTRAQYHLRQVCVFLDLWPINKPEVLIAQAQTKFNDKGELTDEATKKLIQEHLVNLVGWARRMQAQV
ncbi:MAG TPA: NAD(P)H-dependent oxidoreductase [Alphaproteobacteria bacterium]|nr:NAD(P)H-dependent oxidoreductase [Alphaproteobacteria bacterium]